ncbi:MAG TPA: hypothetical protein DDY70_05640 [Clostridiales bacterium]|nr:hypothetical protein [Clostridiales bacterium]
MQPEIRPSINQRNYFILITAMTAIFCLFVLLLSDVFLPIAAALYAVLFLYEKRKVISLIFPVVTIGASAFLGYAAVLAAAFIFLIGATIAQLYRVGLGKWESSLCVTLLFAVHILLLLFILAAVKVGSTSLDAVFGFYTDYMETQKAQFIEAMTSISTTLPDGTPVFAVTAETAEALFFSITRLVVAFLTVVAFFLCGIAYKLFGSVVRRSDADPAKIRRFTFLPPTMFAYFYILLFFLSLFFSDSENNFAVALNNLFYIFLAVFAYVGFKFALFLVHRMRHHGLGIAVFIIFCLFGGVLAAEVFSFLGVFYTVMSRRAVPPPPAE